jgi:hypothetical protein
MNRTTIRTASAVLAVAVTFVLLKGVGMVADVESAAGPSATRLAAAKAAASAAVQVATLQRETTHR